MYMRGFWKKACALVVGAALCLMGAAVPPPALEAYDGVLRTSVDHKQVDIKGASWFGFNVGSGMLDGLWAGIDLSTTTAQLRLLGFNTIRIPFDFSLLHAPAKDFRWANCERRDLLQNTMDPQLHVSRGPTSKPKQLPPRPPLSPAGMCNSYLPRAPSTAEDALLWTVKFLVGQGFYVVLNHHSLISSNQIQRNPSEFAQAWGNLWTRLVSLHEFDSQLKGRVFVDITNEPDFMGMRWEDQPGKMIGAASMYLRVMDRLHSITPKGMLYFVEGTGQTAYGLCWGSGFVTDKNIIARYGLSDASPFLAALLKKPYSDQVVIAPHEYGPLIRKANIVGSDLVERLDSSHGYLAERGFCSGGTCRRFPVVIGEWGSSMASADSTFLRDFAHWMQKRRSVSWIVWAVNANSGDTEGLVTNTLWQDLRWDKLRYMINELGLKPWWKQ